MNNKNTIDTIIETIKKYIAFSSDPITYTKGGGVIKISRLKSPILFIILTKNIITTIDICYNECTSKNYFTTKNRIELKNELNKFIGETYE